MQGAQRCRRQRTVAVGPLRCLNVTRTQTASLFPEFFIRKSAAFPRPSHWKCHQLLALVCKWWAFLLLPACQLSYGFHFRRQGAEDKSETHACPTIYKTMGVCLVSALLHSVCRRSSTPVTSLINTCSLHKAHFPLLGERLRQGEAETE